MRVESQSGAGAARRSPLAGGAGIFYKSLLSVGLLCAEVRGGDRALNYGQHRKMRFSVGSDGGSGSKLIGLFY